MSHISKIELEVKDLTALDQACHRLGLKFFEGQKTFRWYGESASCDHAIRIPEAQYEIGVVRQESGYALTCDFFDPGIEKAIGPNGGRLKQAYAIAKTRAEARKKNYTVIERKTKTGIRLQVRLG